MSYAHNRRKKALKLGLTPKGTKPERMRELAKFINERSQHVTVSNPKAEA